MGEEGKEGEEEEEDTAVLITADKNEYYQTLLAAIFTMSFIILVSGSYFFEWSDTVLKVQINQLLARTTRNDDNAYNNNNFTTNNNMNICADGNKSKFDFGETMSVNLVSVLIKITKVSFRYIVILYNNVIYSMPTVQYCFTQQLYQSLLFLI